MKRVFGLFVALAFFAGVGDALGADQRRIRWIASIYMDASGSGLKHPEGVACGDDYLVVADTGNRRILRYAYEGEVVTPGEEFSLPKSSPLKIQVNSAGDVYFLDGRERRISSISQAGEQKGSLKPRSLPFSSEIVPKSFAIDDDDKIYILDIFSAHVVVLDSEGQYLRRVAFPEKYGFASDVAVDAQGNIFLLDGVEAIVYVARGGAERFSNFSESMRAYVSFPTSLTVDARGVVYVVDQSGGGLALVGQDGEFLGRKLGMGWNESGLYYPAQICVSSSGNLFIADRNNSRVQRFELGDGATVAPAEDTQAVE